ncbi:MAG: tRNA pseudouridine(38-40) synthase TruA [Alphaproteobacteria bacterium]|nr:tRNA pseudouridine(38-40) synthase TruA [Alphaproteobacteria bacterium]
MSRYKITIEYDGTGLLGWQKQLDGPSVQEYIETAIYNFSKKQLSFDKTTKEFRFIADNLDEHSSIEFCDQSSDKTIFIVYGSGRTDAGVHALGQVAHFDLVTEMNEYKLREAMNAHLRQMGANISILEVEKVRDDFHARFDAKKRSYVYKILNRRAPSPLLNNRAWHVNHALDVEKTKEASQYLIGRHDFTSFRATSCQAKSPVKTLDKIEISQKGDEIEFYVEGVSFLHHQVRNIVGTLKEVGEGTLEPKDVKRILEAKDRTQAGVTAPACGLYFNKIWY